MLIASVFAVVALPLVEGSTFRPERIEELGELTRRIQSQVALQPIAWAITIAYFFFCEAFWGGRTVGKRALGLQVVMADGSPLTAVAVLKRSFMRFLDEMLCSFVVGLVAALIDAERRRLGDRVAKTLVVDARLVSEHGWGSGMPFVPPRVDDSLLATSERGERSDHPGDEGSGMPGDPNPWSAR